MPDLHIRNLLLEAVEYKVDTNAFGTWRRFGYPSGEIFEEFVSHKRILGLPLLHYTRGRCPETGKRIIAKGIIAVGRLAVGVLAVGHAAAGLVAVGQLGLGVILGLGQAATGLYAVGQLALALTFGLGQIATGYTAIGQFAYGKYVLAQYGRGEFVWDMRHAAPAAVSYFRSLFP